MLFNSTVFIFVFLPIAWILYFLINRQGNSVAAKVWLVSASLFFYGWWNPLYLPIIICSILANYSLGCVLSSDDARLERFKKLILVTGISANLGLLAYFKYANFLLDNISFVFNVEIDHLDLVLPLAISFFTFQQVAYLVDSYKNIAEEHNFINYCLFVSFFPQLIAGPIVHHKEMLPQFQVSNNRVVNLDNLAAGILIFSIGLFKKIVIADAFAVWASNGFDQSSTLHFVEAWVTSLSYSCQLYFDFSGYSDMAIGLALMFNIRLPFNFNSPYKSTSIQDFWRRWHMTLSTFLREYVYIPLGGNRNGEFSTYNNLMATFLLGGLWHGAGWTFIIWGFLHGFALVIHRIWSKMGFRLWTWLAWLVTFNFVNVAWIFFRASSWEDAIKVLKGMVGLNGFVLHPRLSNALSFLGDAEFLRYGDMLGGIGGGVSTIIALAAIAPLVMFAPNANGYTRAHIDYRHMVAAAILFSVAIVFMVSSSSQVFLYFNF